MMWNFIKILIFLKIVLADSEEHSSELLLDRPFCNPHDSCSKKNKQENTSLGCGSHTKSEIYMITDTSEGLEQTSRKIPEFLIQKEVKNIFKNEKELMETQPLFEKVETYQSKEKMNETDLSGLYTFKKQNPPFSEHFSCVINSESEEDERISFEQRRIYLGDNCDVILICVYFILGIIIAVKMVCVFGPAIFAFFTRMLAIFKTRTILNQ